jgi:hypothetical protein
VTATVEATSAASASGRMEARRRIRPMRRRVEARP